MILLNFTNNYKQSSNDLNLMQHLELYFLVKHTPIILFYLQLDFELMSYLFVYIVYYDMIMLRRFYKVSWCVMFHLLYMI